MKKRIFSAGISLLLAGSLLTGSVFAAEWYLEDGDIEISVTSEGQKVSQGGVIQEDSAPVITQRDASVTTENTVTIKTDAGMTAEVTLKDVNIRNADGSGMEIGDSSAEITLEGSNQVSGSQAGLHVSGGELTLRGSGSLDAQGGSQGGAGIGSQAGEEMSGGIHITGETQVTASGESGAGIGSGGSGAMSGEITVEDKAQVTASSSSGAGIGSGAGLGRYSTSGNADAAQMSGSIHITGESRTTSFSRSGAGIGSGNAGKVSGEITIDGSARVTAASREGGAGIGGGGAVTPSARLTIGGNAVVEAVGGQYGSGIGAGIFSRNGSTDMGGAVIIRDQANVTAIGGEDGAAIGGRDKNSFTGTILLLDMAEITTGQSSTAADFDKASGRITYTVGGNPGQIGAQGGPYHQADQGQFILGENVTINGLSALATAQLQDYINMYIEEGRVENLGIIAVQGLGLVEEDGREHAAAVTFLSSGSGKITGTILYNGGTALPRGVGRYEVTFVLDGSGTEFRLGTIDIVLPGTVPAAAGQTAPCFRVLDKEGRDLPYTETLEDGVLTVMTEAETATLTGTVRNVQALTARGVKKIVFSTAGAESVFLPTELLAAGEGGSIYALTHDGKETEFLLDGNIDLSRLLK